MTSSRSCSHRCRTAGRSTLRTGCSRCSTSVHTHSLRGRARGVSASQCRQARGERRISLPGRHAMYVAKRAHSRPSSSRWSEGIVGAGSRCSASSVDRGDEAHAPTTRDSSSCEPAIRGFRPCCAGIIPCLMWSRRPSSSAREHTGLMHPLASRARARREPRVARGIELHRGEPLSRQSARRRAAEVRGRPARGRGPAAGRSTSRSPSTPMPARCAVEVVQLRRLGARISIDDFGAGTRRSHAPAALGRRDQGHMSFVLGMVDDRRRDHRSDDDRAWPSLRLSRGRKCRDVGSARDAARWVAIAQGYWLSRPLPGPEALEWLRRHGRSRGGRQVVQPGALTRR